MSKPLPAPAPEENVTALLAGRPSWRAWPCGPGGALLALLALGSMTSTIFLDNPPLALPVPGLVALGSLLLWLRPGRAWIPTGRQGVVAGRSGRRWVLAAGFTVTAVPSQVSGNPHGFVRGLHEVLPPSHAVDVVVGQVPARGGKASKTRPWLPAGDPALGQARPAGSSKERSFSIVVRAPASPFKGLGQQLDAFAGVVDAVRPLLARYHHHGFEALSPAAVATLVDAVTGGKPVREKAVMPGAILVLAGLAWAVVPALLVPAVAPGARGLLAAWLLVAGIPALVDAAGWALSTRWLAGTHPVQSDGTGWTRHASKAYPLKPSFDHGPVLRALDHESRDVDTFLAITALPRDPAWFGKRAALVPRAAAALAAMTPAQVGNRLAGFCNAWAVSYLAGARGEGADRVLLACLAGTGSGIGLHDRGARRAAFLGAELVPGFTVPKELASPNVPLVTPVEVLAPAGMACDVVLGTLVNAEWLVGQGEGGIAWTDLGGGMVVAGGTPAERLGVLRLLLEAWATRGGPCPVVVIDDHGDLLVPGATRVRVGGHGNQVVNPLLPAGGAAPGAPAARDDARKAIAYLAKVLTVTFGWRLDVAAWFTREATRHVDEAVLRGMVPTITDLAGTVTFGGKGAVEKAVDAALSVAFDSACGMHDSPAFDPSRLGKAPLVLDLSGLHGVEKDVVKLVLVAKATGMVAASGAPATIVVPELDKAMHDTRQRLDSSAFVELAYTLFNGIGAAGGCAIVSLENPGKLPVSLLSRFHVVVSHALAWDDDVAAMSHVLGLEREELYGRGRHASYQQRYLREMGPGMAFVRRPGIPAPFLVKGKIAPVQGRPAGQGAGTGQGSPAVVPPQSHGRTVLDRILSGFGPARAGIDAILRNAATIKHHGIKRSGLMALWEPVLREAILAREPGLKEGDARARARVMADRLADTLVHHGVLVVDTYNPSGLVDGTTLKLSAFGARAIADGTGQATAVAGVPAAFTVPAGVASSFGTIHEYLARRDWAGLRDVLLAGIQDIVARSPDPAALAVSVPTLADDVRACVDPDPADMEAVATRLLADYQAIAGAGRA